MVGSPGAGGAGEPGEEAGRWWPVRQTRRGLHLVDRGPLASIFDRAFAYLPPEERAALAEMVRLPAETAVLRRNAEISTLVQPFAPFFKAWATYPGALVPREDVLGLSAAWYGELKYFGWFRNPLAPLLSSERRREAQANPDAPGSKFRLEGLAALQRLFGTELARELPGHRADACPEFRLYPPGVFAPGERVVLRSDWERAFVVALYAFGDAELGHGAARAVTPHFTERPELVERWLAVRDLQPRPALLPLRLFAWSWDNLAVPTRFWAKTAAWAFMRRHASLGLDYAPFTKRFYHQGDADKRTKEGAGLTGLVPRRPPVVHTWPKEKGDRKAVVSRGGAKAHGLDPELCRQALEAAGFGVRVELA